MSSASLDTFGRDVRYAARGLRRNPLFTLVALVTLAVGIGASTAVFSVVNSVLLKPLPYPEAERLVSIWHDAPGPGAAGLTDVSGGLRPSLSMYFTYAEHNRTFDQVGLWTPQAANVTGVAEPEEVRALVVTDGVLQALGVQPFLGRWLSAADQEPGSAGAVMLSYGYWQRRFGGDRAAVGRTLTVNTAPLEVVGVMPEGFRIADAPFDIVVPIRADRSRIILPGFCCQVVARLKPGATIADANADIRRMLPIWTESWPWPGGSAEQARENYLGRWAITPAVRPLKQDVVGGIDDLLWVVMGTIGVVLLIACANVANLLLVRAEARSQELAIRSALGAGSWRIARALMIESVLLALVGGVLGWALANGALRALIAMAPGNLPRSTEIALDGYAFVFALGISVAAGIVLGLIPSLKNAGPRISAVLHSGGRGSSQGRERYRTQNVLVVAQVALALVLLVSSGLMMRTFAAMRAVEPGFTQAEHLQTMRIAIPELLVAEPERVTRMQNDIIDALAAIPGVQSAAFASAMPLEGRLSNWDGIDVEDRPRLTGEPGSLRRFKYVSPGFFGTAGTRLVQGRDITWTDIYDNRRVAMISENLARELWGEPARALGKRIRGPIGGPWREIIGVVQDVPDNSLSEPAPAIVYWPSMMTGFYRADDRSLVRAVTVVVRSERAGTASLIQEIQDAVWSVNPSLPVASIRTMQAIYDASLARTSFTLVMLAIAASAALGLGIVGLYGVLSYAVSQRRREIAIRLALGAQRRDVIRSVVRHGVALAAIGIVFGIGAALGVTRLMTSLLFGITPIDLPTYGVVAIVLTVVAALASYLPARRASGVNPAEALTAE